MLLPAKAVKYELERSGKTVLHQTVEQVVIGNEPNQKNLAEMKDIVKEMKEKARSEYKVPFAARKVLVYRLQTYGRCFPAVSPCSTND